MTSTLGSIIESRMISASICPLCANTTHVTAFFRRWFANAWVQLSICVLLSTAAEILIKLGATETADPASAWSWTGLTGLTSRWVWWGIVASIGALFTWLAT